MEPHNLQAASTYINNVLLARGLLKDGRAIEFGLPENEEGGTDATMARIINLVNDLVLRRDREAEHRESLANTIRTLREDDSQKAVEIGKLKAKASELSRSLALAEAQERTLKSNVSSAEATIRGFKEQVQRMKTAVQQIRGQCANDIRKRDLEMQKLKSHLAERQRGKREGLNVTTININPAVDRASRTRSLIGGEGVNDPGYSLKQETTEFLTELCQNLSDENDALISLARNTVQTLRDLQGLSQMEEEDEYSNGTASIRTMKSSHGSVTTLPATCEELSGQMDRVLDHLRTLLTNPSFVPLEEVEVRDEEIKRLREGWEKMESRWGQAVTMMDGWHRRIADGGGSVQAEELRRGMTLDISLDSMQTSSVDDDGGMTLQSPIFEDQKAEEEEEAADNAAKHNPEQDQTRDDTNDKQPLTREKKVRKAPSRALKERSDNIISARSPRKVSFTPGLQGSPCEPSGEGGDETLQVKAHRSDAVTVTRRPSRKKMDSKTSLESLSNKSQMSVSQKLAAAESEARAAEQARRETESRKRTRGVKGSKKADRRRSTLTSDELGELMGMPSS